MPASLISVWNTNGADCLILWVKIRLQPYAWRLAEWQIENVSVSKCFWYGDQKRRVEQYQLRTPDVVSLLPRIIFSSLHASPRAYALPCVWLCFPEAMLTVLSSMYSRKLCPPCFRLCIPESYALLAFVYAFPMRYTQETPRAFIFALSSPCLSVFSSVPSRNHDLPCFLGVGYSA